MAVSSITMSGVDHVGGLSSSSGKKSRSWVNWFRYAVAPIRVMDRKRGGFDCDLDVKYLAELLVAQEGRCAISGMKMTHVAGDLCACSIDRLDLSMGHVKGNVQLVCLWVNRAKHRHSDAAMREVLVRFREQVLSGE